MKKSGALNSSKAGAGKDMSLSRWCSASLYIYHLSFVIDFSSEKHIVSTGHRYSEHADGETQTNDSMARALNF